MRGLSWYYCTIKFIKKLFLKSSMNRKLAVIFFALVFAFSTAASCGKNPSNPNGGAPDAGGDSEILYNTDLNEVRPVFVEKSNGTKCIQIKTPGELIWLNNNQGEIGEYNIEIINDLDLQKREIQGITTFGRVFEGNGKNSSQFQNRQTRR